MFYCYLNRKGTKMKIQKFSKSNLPLLREAMTAALEPVEKLFGMSIDLGSCRFRTHEASFKLKLSILTEDGVDQGAIDNFMRYALYRGFDKEDFGKDFTKDGRQFKIVGWTNRRHKYPVDVKEVATAQPYCFTPASVLQGLGKPVNSIL